MNETKSFIDSVIGISHGGGEGRSEAGDQGDSKVNKIAESIISRLPRPFDTESAEKKYPTSYSDSMNTVLVQVSEYPKV